jgi:hypothetical protein
MYKYIFIYKLIKRIMHHDEMNGYIHRLSEKTCVIISTDVNKAFAKIQQFFMT